MGTEALKMMKEQLMSCAQGEMGNLREVDAHELGEVIDMIKDLAEAIYYCTITDSMEKSEDSKNGGETNINYYTSPMYNKMYPDYRDMERTSGYMYYPSGGSGGSSGGSSGGGNSGGSSGGNSGGSGGRGGSGGSSSSGGGRSYYTEIPGDMMRDPRQGRSPMRRRMYMEGKETNNDTKSQLRELEAYLQELSTDITEMIKDASPEEKATLHQKMTMLANKMV